MPLAKVRRGIALLFQDLSDRDLFGPHRPGRPELTETSRISTRHDAATGRTTVGGSGVKAIKPETAASHLVQYRRLQLRMPVVSDFGPALIIRHAEDDVGSVQVPVRFRFSGRRRRTESNQDRQQNKGKSRLVHGDPTGVQVACRGSTREVCFSCFWARILACGVVSCSRPRAKNASESRIRRRSAENIMTQSFTSGSDTRAWNPRRVRIGSDQY